MHMILNAMILAVLIPASGTRTAQDGPSCRAELKGTNLLTTYELPGGVLVEGPWRVMHTGSVAEGQAHFTMFAVLDHVVEKDALTGQRNVIPFPEPVRLAFEGATQQDLVQRAAQVWCVTVMRAQENQALDQLSPKRNMVTRIAGMPRPLMAG
jgi:hypothetical protein